MDRHPGNLDALGSDAIVDKLASSLIARYQVKRYVVTGPTFPKTVVGVGNNRNEWNPIGEFQFPQHSAEEMLRQRMDTHNHVRTPTFKNLGHVTNATLVEKLACLGTNPVNKPIQVFHPVLFVSQHPIVEVN
jgi:hypothetical protein